MPETWNHLRGQGGGARQTVEQFSCQTARSPAATNPLFSKGIVTPRGGRKRKDMSFQGKFGRSWYKNFGVTLATATGGSMLKPGVWSCRIPAFLVLLTVGYLPVWAADGPEASVLPKLASEAIPAERLQ